MKHEFPKQITKTFYLHADETWPTNLQISTADMSDLAWILPYGTVEVTVDVPADLPDPTEMRIQSLEKEHDRIKADASKKLDNIRDQIDRLKAITYTPEEA